MFYAAIPGETLGLISDNAPYGFTYTSPAPPLFTTPFVDAATGNVEGQRFPAQLAPLNVSRSNPDTNLDFSQFEPISAIPGYKTTNRIPYTESYIAVAAAADWKQYLLSVSYVGNQAHHLLVLEAANPGNPALCLSLSQPSQVAPGSATCGPFGESTVYTSASGQIINGTRGPLGPAFGSVSYQASIGNSNYNALEASLHHTSGRTAVVCQLYLQQIHRPGFEFGRPGGPFQSEPQPRTFVLRYEAQLRRQLQLPVAIRTSLSRPQSLDGGLVDFRNHPFQHRPSR